MLGLVVRAAHLPPGPRPRGPDSRPVPGAPCASVQTFPLRGGLGLCETAPPLRPGSGCCAPAPPPGAQSQGSLVSPPYPRPPPRHSRLQPGGFPRPPDGAGQGPEGGLPAILQPQLNPWKMGTVEVPEFLCGFRGRHLVGRGLKCLSSGWFAEHWTLDCLRQRECSGPEKDLRAFFRNLFTHQSKYPVPPPPQPSRPVRTPGAAH